MRLLLTGATGELGTALLSTLIGDGHEVIATTRRAPPPPSPASPTWIAWDLAHGPAPPQALDGVEAVLHLAGKKYDALAPPETFTSSNVDATSQLLDAIAARGRAPAPHVVFFSTMYVYGESSVAPLSESARPEPRTAYGLSKLRAEQRLADACASREIPFTILRLTTVYGTGAVDVLAHMANIYRRVFPFVLGAGEQRRSLLSIDNLRQIVRSVLRDPAWRGQTVNVADPLAYRMIDIATYLAGGRPVRHIPERLARAPGALRSSVGALVPRYAAFCDQVERLAESFCLDTTRLCAMNVGPLHTLPVERA
jgi:nucleoside-diphosphate-sugar epimerase